MVTFSPMKLIIAMDPGGTTGLAYWTLDDLWGREQIDCCDDDFRLSTLFSRLEGICRYAQPFTGHKSVHIVYEPFEFRKDERDRYKIDYTAAEVVGALRLWAYSRDYVKLVRSGASKGKGFWIDDKIKALGLWVPGQRHAMDATRHLLAYRSFQLNDLSLFEPFRPPATGVEIL